MTQEKKQLLLQDLCARLPYGVKIQVYDNRYAPTTLTAIDIKKKECIFGFNIPIENCLPYLRPMSSMTDEEKGQTRDFWIDADTRTFAIRLIDFYNKNHFDYRGLISKGLALEAPEGMYNT